MERTEAATARLTRQEKVALIRMAEQDERSISEWLREMIRREGERRGIWSVELVPEATA